MQPAEQDEQLVPDRAGRDQLGAFRSSCGTAGNAADDVKVSHHSQHTRLSFTLVSDRYGIGHQASSSAGSVLTLRSSESFDAAVDFAQDRIDSLIASKLDEFFEMAEYDWTPPLPASMRKRGVVSGTAAQAVNRPSSPAVGQAGQRQSTTMQWFDANTTREPSTYLFEMITFLTAYVDSVLIMLNERIKTRAYRKALEHINGGLLVRILGGVLIT